ncbi:apolipoprotein N-acyltransferase [soil metagenome]
MAISSPSATIPKPRRSIDGPEVSTRNPHPVVFGVGSALLLYAAFEPAGWWWLAWVALVPLGMLIRSDRPARAVYLGAWVGGLVFWLLATNWVRKADPGAWPGWIALAVGLSFWWPAFLLLARSAVRRLGVPLMIAAPLAWVALEFVRGHAPFNGFSWFYLAHSQHSLLPMIQVADLAGAWGLSLLIALFNACVVGWLTRSDQRIRLLVIGTAVVGILLVTTLGYGFSRLASADFRPGPRLALLQSDIPQVFNRPKDASEIVHIYGRLIEQALQAEEPPDLIVWPEASYPHGFITIDPALDPEELARLVATYDPENTVEGLIARMEATRENLHGWTDRVQTPMLIGVNFYEFRPGKLNRYNSAILFQPHQPATTAYHKQHLVPFGEYVPLVESMPWILSLTPFDENHIPRLNTGAGPTPLELGDWRLGVAICFEDSVPHVARKAAVGTGTGAGAGGGEPERRPDVLLNLSNDGWFRGTAAHELHLANSVFRAVELRLPVARAVNTGISALIDADGRVREALPPMKEGVLSVVVPLDDRRSLYASLGDWLPWSCLILSVGLALLATLLTTRDRRRARVSAIKLPGAG